MSRYPTPRPAGPSQRPPAPGGAPAATIDPVKLLKKYKFVIAAAFITSVFVGVGSFLVLRQFMPRYQSTVMYRTFPAEVRVDQVNITGVNREEMDRFMRTQAATMMSDVVLSEVVDDRRLNDEARSWVKDYLLSNGQVDQVEALKALKGSVTANVVPETYFIQMGVSAGDPTAAAGLARLVKESYMRLLSQQVTANIVNKRDTLTTQITELGREIEDLSARRARIVKDEELETIDSGRLEAATKLDSVSELLLGVEQNIEAIGTQIERYDEMLTSPTGIQYTDSQRSQAEQTPIVANLRSQIKQAEAAQLTMQNQGIGPSHRNYRALTSRIAGLEQKLADEREIKLREIFDAEVDSTRRAMAQLRAQEADLLDQREELRSKLTELTGILAEVSDLRNEINGRIAQREDAKAQLNNIESQASLDRVGRVAVHQAQTVPSEMSFPKIIIIVPLAVFLICGATGGSIVLRELLDQRVKSASDVGMIPRTRVVGVVPIASEDPTSPERVELAFGDQPRGVIAETFRNIRTSMMKSVQRAGHRSIVVAAGLPGSGATSTITNLALAVAATDQRVLIIDGNFRRPAMHKVFDLGDGVGLADVLADEASLGDACRQTPNANLDVLTAGSREHRIYERLGSERMASVLNEAGDDYDLVLIDVAPCIVSGDAYAVANRADASVLVVRALREKRGMVARLKNELSECRAECLGVLVNAVRSAAGGYLRTNIRTSHEYQEQDEPVAAEPAAAGASES